MNGVEYIIGTADVVNTPIRVYDDTACAFIAELSAEILKSPLARAYPDLSALAFWGRKANLQKLKEAFGDTAGRLGRGLCFHIAPSNIPVNFAFTYLFGLLAGNANIVRLPSKTFPQIDALCALMKKVLSRYPEIEKIIYICNRYGVTLNDLFEEEVPRQAAASPVRHAAAPLFRQASGRLRRQHLHR